jgi:hypothetical protein
MSGAGGLSADDEQWQKEFSLAQHNELTNVRGVAEKWSAGIATIIGAFSAISVVIVPDKLSDLHYGPAKWTVLILAAAAGFFGVVALSKAHSAAYGNPKADDQATWETYKDDAIRLAASSAKSLRCSRRWTAFALVAIALGALVSQLDGLIYKPGTPAVYVLVTSPRQAAVCGALQQSGAVATVGTATIPASSTVTIVAHC